MLTADAIIISILIQRLIFLDRQEVRLEIGCHNGRWDLIRRVRLMMYPLNIRLFQHLATGDLVALLRLFNPEKERPLEYYVLRKGLY